MRKMTNSYCVLLHDVVVERPLVVDQEVEDAMLIRAFKVDRVGCTICRDHSRGQGQAVEGRQHRELELQHIFLGDDEGSPVVPYVFGHGD